MYIKMYIGHQKVCNNFSSMARSEKIFLHSVCLFFNKTSHKKQFTILDYVLLLDIIYWLFILRQSVHFFFFRYKEKKNLLILLTLCIICYVKVCATTNKFMVHIYTTFTRLDYRRSTIDILTIYNTRSIRNSNKY